MVSLSKLIVTSLKRASGCGSIKMEILVLNLMILHAEFGPSCLNWYKCRFLEDLFSVRVSARWWAYLHQHSKTNAGKLLHAAQTISVCLLCALRGGWHIHMHAFSCIHLMKNCSIVPLCVWVYVYVGYFGGLMDSSCLVTLACAYSVYEGVCVHAQRCSTWDHHNHVMVT